MTSHDIAALNRAVDVDLKDGTTIRVETHGPHPVGETICIIVWAGDDCETIRVTVDETGALVEWASVIHADLREAAWTPLALDGVPCVPCEVHAAVGDAVAALLPSDPTPRQVALHAALDDLIRLMPGHEHAEETP